MIFNAILLFIVIFLVIARKFEPICFLFIFFLPTANLFGDYANILGVLGYHEILSLAVILMYFFNKIKYNFSPPKNRYTKMISFLLFSFFIILFYVPLKEMYIGFGQFNFDIILKRIFKTVLEFSSILIIIRNINYNNYKNIIYAIFSSFYLLVMFAIISNFYEISFINKYDDRVSGIITGNANDYAIIITICLGLVLYLLEKKDIVNYNFLQLTFFLSFIAILLTGSRTGLFSFLIILFIFYLRNIRIRNISGPIIFIVVLFVIFNYFGANTLNRLSLFVDQTDNIAEEARIFKWIIYIQHIIDNPHFLLFGSDSHAYHRAAHNLFISSIHDAGLIISSFLFIAYSRITRLSYNYLEFSYVFLPFLFASIMGSSITFYYHFVILIPLIGFLKENYK